MGAVHPSRITPAAESGPGGAEAGGAPRNVCLMKRNRLLPMLFALLLLAIAISAFNIWRKLRKKSRDNY